MAAIQKGFWMVEEFFSLCAVYSAASKLRPLYAGLIGSSLDLLA